MSKALLKKVDCLLLPVPSVEAGLAFYRDQLGHELIWRTPTAVGLKMGGSDTEIVLHAEHKEAETDILVDSADEAVPRFVAAGGEIVKEPFDIEIGRCAVVKDPFGNILVFLDMTKGNLKTDKAGNVIPR
ncbi:MAG: VOC family protein [Patescibacteria group bacterium]|mgnify:CR=1 FL=1